MSYFAREGEIVAAGVENEGVIDSRGIGNRIRIKMNVDGEDVYMSVSKDWYIQSGFVPGKKVKVIIELKE